MSLSGSFAGALNKTNPMVDTDITRAYRTGQYIFQFLFSAELTASPVTPHCKVKLSNGVCSCRVVQAISSVNMSVVLPCEPTVPSKSHRHTSMGRFAAFGKERWGWTAAKAEAKWQEALADPLVAKVTDQEGWTTVAKYALSSERSLNHDRQISSISHTEAHLHELKSVATDMLDTGKLHSHTGVFDTKSLPALPGFGRFGCGGASKPKVTHQTFMTLSTL